MNHGKSLRMR